MPNGSALESSLAHDGALASPTDLARLAAVGVAFDLATWQQHFPGISIPMFLAAVIALLRRQLRRSWRDDALFAAAIAFGSFSALRASRPLAVLDAGVAIGLIGLVASTSPDGVFRLGVRDAIESGRQLALGALTVPAFVLRPVAHAWSRVEIGRAKPVLRAIAIAVPVLALFAGLLASADRVFGRLLFPRLPHWNLGTAIIHVALIGFGAAYAAIVWCTAVRREWGADTLAAPRPTRFRLSFVEWTVVLGGIDVLFLGFVGVQFAVLFGGRHRVLVTPGLTYAEYARSGFFQLITVAALTVLVIVAVWDYGARHDPTHDRWFRALELVMVGFSFVILVSAWRRLGLYEDAFGATVNRFAATIAIAWIAFVLAAAPVLMRPGSRRRFLSVALAAGLAAFFAFNVANPERTVAERNVARFRVRHAIDLGYLGSVLGADAIPVVVDLLPSLDPPAQADLRESLCAQAQMIGAREPRIGSWNAGRSLARVALQRAGIPRACFQRPPD